jgi:hypothetical protein
MNKYIAGFLAGLCLLAGADSKVLSVDTNNVVNTDAISITGISATRVYTVTNTVGPRVFDGTSWITKEGGYTKTFDLPVYLFSVTNYPGYNGSSTDRLASEWYVSGKLRDIKAELSVFGDKKLYEAYTNSPPTNLVSAVNYLSNCVYLLSNVEVQTSFNDVTNEIGAIEAKLVDLETRSNRFGGGVDELDYIINSDIENMDAGDMLDMIKTMARYIRNGTTNGTVAAGSSEQAE